MWSVEVESSQNLVTEAYHTTLLNATIHSIVEKRKKCKGYAKVVRIGPSYGTIGCEIRRGYYFASVDDDKQQISSHVFHKTSCVLTLLHKQIDLIFKDRVMSEILEKA